MKYLLLVGVIFIINYTTGRGYYNQQRIHLTTLEVGEFCAKMLKRGFENKEKPGETVHPDTAFRTGFVAVKVGLHAEDV